MLFHEFMQMGSPAAFALVGLAFSVCGVAIVVVVNQQIERNALRKHEIEHIQQASMAKQIEHKGSKARDVDSM